MHMRDNNQEIKEGMPRGIERQTVDSNEGNS